jgi:hypothetical protein
MNYRLNKTSVAVVAILILAAVGLFGYTLVKAPTQEEVTVPSQTKPTVPQTTRTITAMHQYKDGVHTIAGSVELPTPCYRLFTEPFFVGDTKDEVEIRFTTATEDTTCAQALTPVRFKVTFDAPESVHMTATWDGTPASLNLVPVREGQDLDSYELEVKG